ncbi:G2/mitotic-specific cyclin-B-like [Haemaphysalis longicornis]
MQQEEDPAPSSGDTGHVGEGPTKEAITSTPQKAVEDYHAFSTSLLPREVWDIDKKDGRAPLLLSEYAKDIFGYLAELESSLPVRQDFLSMQPEVTSSMRTLLIDWLMNVHANFKLHQETLFLTVALIDRYLQCQVVSRSRLQLLGMSALYVACKFEETLVPVLSELTILADGAYRAEQVLKMEGAILDALDWRLGRPLPLHFLRRNSKAAQVGVVEHTMAKYILELCLLNYPMAWVKPSEQAAAALCLAIHICGKGHSWGPTISFYSRYEEEALQPTIKEMAAILAEAPTSKNNAPYEKYKAIHNHEVSGKALASSALLQKIARQGSLA